MTPLPWGPTHRWWLRGAAADGGMGAGDVAEAADDTAMRLVELYSHRDPHWRRR